MQPELYFLVNLEPIAPVLAMEWAAILGRNVKRLRMARKATQEAIAFAADMDVRYLREIEKGRANVTLEMLEGLCDAFEVELAELTDGMKKRAKKG